MVTPQTPCRHEFGGRHGIPPGQDNANRFKPRIFAGYEQIGRQAFTEKPELSITNNLWAVAWAKIGTSLEGLYTHCEVEPLTLGGLICFAFRETMMIYYVV